MNKLVCQVCGFIDLRGNAPENCPVCGAPKSQFQGSDDAVKLPENPSNLSELEKKHIPVITVLKKCGLIEGCTDIHVKMGEIIHPMQEEHSIQKIDFYIDENFIVRIQLTPEKVQPAGGLHLKVSSGKLNVISHCNVHGRWIKETEL